MALFSRFDIFISYSRAQTERVRPLVAELESRGYKIFFDQQSIDPGSNWKVRLRTAIRQSRATILCWSTEAKLSDYIQFELNQALVLQQTVVPWLLDSARLPDMHRELQCIADPNPKKVADQVARLLGWSADRRRKLFAVAAILLAGSGAAFIGTRPEPLPPTWQFSGDLNDRGAPVAGMTITWQDAPNPGSISAVSDGSGRYTLVLPGKRQQYPNLRLLLHSSNYCEAVTASTSVERYSLTLDPLKANGC